MKQTTKISVSGIRLFKKNSTHIKKNDIIPILDFIKFDNGTITKTNLHEFVVQESKESHDYLALIRSHHEYTHGYWIEHIEKEINLPDILLKSHQKYS